MFNIFVDDVSSALGAVPLLSLLNGKVCDSCLGLAVHGLAMDSFEKLWTPHADLHTRNGNRTHAKEAAGRPT